MPRNEQFNVRPRYCVGSPGLVSDRQAVKVAADEIEFHAFAMSGIYGEESRAQAEREGLDGISVWMLETTKGWIAFDLITGRTWIWPFTGTCQTCGARKVRAERGVLQDHTHRRSISACPGGQSVGQEQSEEHGPWRRVPIDLREAQAEIVEAARTA